MFGCTTRENNKKTSIVLDTINSTTLTGQAPLETEKLIILFDKGKDFEILNLSRDITKQSSARDTSMCKGWTIEKENIAKILKESEPMNGEDWHHLFDVLPCVLRGQILQDGRPYGVEVNAGSWLYISSQDTTLIFGSFEKKNEKFFVSSAMTSE
jgi:hypothetical protein